jgi:hypothetical protein
MVRPRGVSGLGKALWVILLIVLPYIGIFADIPTQGGGMAERNLAQVRQLRDELRETIGFNVADELTKLDPLKARNSLSEDEYPGLRGRLVA